MTQEIRGLDGYERMDPNEGKGQEEPKNEEESLRSVGRLLLGYWPDRMAGLVREILGRLGYVSPLAG